MTTTITLLGLLISTMSLVYLRNTDPKRRRVFGLPAWGTRRYQKEAWLLSVFPGCICLWLEDYSSLIMWLAAFSLVGWLIALMRPSK